MPSIGATGRGKLVWAMDCSRVAGLGLSHLLEPRRISKAPAFGGWLTSYVKLKLVEKLNGQRMSTHSMYGIWLIFPYKEIG